MIQSQKIVTYFDNSFLMVFRIITEYTHSLYFLHSFVYSQFLFHTFLHYPFPCIWHFFLCNSFFHLFHPFFHCFLYHIMILVYFTVGSTSSGSAFIIAPKLSSSRSHFEDDSAPYISWSGFPIGSAILLYYLKTSLWHE